MTDAPEHPPVAPSARRGHCSCSHPAGSPDTAPPNSAAQPPDPSRSGRQAQARQLTVWIDGELHRRMSRCKVELDQTFKSQVRQAIHDFLDRKGF